MGPGKNQININRVGRWIWGCLKAFMKKHQISRLVPGLPKSWKLVQGLPKFNTHFAAEITRIPTSLESWFLQYFSCQKLVSNPRCQDSNTFFNQRYPKKSENGIATSIPNQQKLKPGRQRVFPCAPKCPRIAPGSPRTPKWSHQACQWMRLSTKYHNILYKNAKNLNALKF